jgi:hypothetical protein
VLSKAKHGIASRNVQMIPRFAALSIGLMSFKRISFFAEHGFGPKMIEIPAFLQVDGDD